MHDHAEILKFTGPDVEGFDVYNPTAPFDDNGILTMAARVESRNSETDTHVLFFTQKDDTWERIPGTPSFPLQDPFITRIHGELVFGGVAYPVENNSWKTLFYRGKTVNELTLFAEGPLTMKDIRVVELADGRVGVFTRPMGEIGGRGKIGFTTIDSLDELSSLDMAHAPLIEGQFGEDTWGGANEVQLLPSGLIGILGHTAMFGEDEAGNSLKIYRAMAFTFDPVKHAASEIKIIAERTDFPDGEAKRDPEIKYVVISGGGALRDDGRMDYYCGLSDVNCAKAVIDNPFVDSIG